MDELNATEIECKDGTIWTNSEHIGNEMRQVMHRWNVGKGADMKAAIRRGITGN